MNDRIETLCALIQYAVMTQQKYLQVDLLQQLCPGIPVDLENPPTVYYDAEGKLDHLIPFIDVDQIELTLDDLVGRRVTDIKQWQEEAMRTISTPIKETVGLQCHTAPSGRIRPHGKSNDRHFPRR